MAVEVSSLPEPPDVELLVGSFDVPGAPPARRRRGDGPAALAGGMPLGRRADARLARALPARGEPRGDRGHRVRGPGPHAGGARGPAAADRLPGARARRSTRAARSTSTTWRPGSSTSWSAVTPTSSPTTPADTPAAVEANWETIKAGEKQERKHPLDGVPLSLPALARAEKYVGGWSGPGATTSSTRPSRAVTSGPCCSTPSGGPVRPASTPRARSGTPCASWWPPARRPPSPSVRPVSRPRGSAPRHAGCARGSSGPARSTSCRRSRGRAGPCPPRRGPSGRRPARGR